MTENTEPDNLRMLYNQNIDFIQRTVAEPHLFSELVQNIRRLNNLPPVISTGKRIYTVVVLLPVLIIILLCSIGLIYLPLKVLSSASEYQLLSLVVPIGVGIINITLLYNSFKKIWNVIDLKNNEAQLLYHELLGGKIISARIRSVEIAAQDTSVDYHFSESNWKVTFVLTENPWNGGTYFTKNINGLKPEDEVYLLYAGNNLYALL